MTLLHKAAQFKQIDRWTILRCFIFLVNPFSHILQISSCYYVITHYRILYLRLNIVHKNERFGRASEQIMKPLYSRIWF